MTQSLNDRAYWVSVLERVARPVLTALAAGRLKRDMPLETGKDEAIKTREKFAHLEAIGRTLAGIGPWLECEAVTGDEASLRDEMLQLTIRGLAHMVDPASADCLDFVAGQQVVVDTAFLAQGLLRAPSLWRSLDDVTRDRLTVAMKTTRRFKPPFNNWLLFAAMNETMLREAGAGHDNMRIDYALRQHEQWYKGDGVYGDGPAFHWDYYNAFVIQPMLLDVLDRVAGDDRTWQTMHPEVVARAKRHAAIQERLISPEGTIPPIGRSLAYRFGALQVLGQMSLRHELPSELAPAQVRCAMTAVIRRMIEAPDTFNEHGWLRVGFCGYQPSIGEHYISRGSVYLCAVGLLPLGLPPSDAFWQDPPLQWTSQKAWSGQDLAADHAI